MDYFKNFSLSTKGKFCGLWELVVAAIVVSFGMSLYDSTKPMLWAGLSSFIIVVWMGIRYFSA
jgi:hypothetical protein